MTTEDRVNLNELRIQKLRAEADSRVALVTELKYLVDEIYDRVTQPMDFHPSNNANHTRVLLELARPLFNELKEHFNG